jgi:hypothetical protein
MKKIIQLLILSLAFLGSANAVFYGAYGSEVYDVYKTEKNISGAFGMKLGVIYNQDFIKPTILEPVILDSLDEQATYIATLKVVLIEYESGYEKGNRVKGENAPQYLTEFRLQVNQHKQSYQITAFSDEMKKENCQKYQVDFMKALDSKYNLIPSDFEFTSDSFDYPHTYTVRSLLDNENRSISVYCGERLEVEYTDWNLKGKYRDYVNIEATKKVLEVRDDYDI